MNRDYIIIEDNGGGLHAFIMRNGKAIWGCYNLEYLNHVDFMAALDGITSHKLHSLWRWDSVYENPNNAYAEITGFTHGWRIIADNNLLYPDVMGAAGMYAYGIEE